MVGIMRSIVNIWNEIVAHLKIHGLQVGSSRGFRSHWSDARTFIGFDFDALDTPSIMLAMFPMTDQLLCFQKTFRKCPIVAFKADYPNYTNNWLGMWANCWTITSKNSNVWSKIFPCFIWGELELIFPTQNIHRACWIIKDHRFLKCFSSHGMSRRSKNVSISISVYSIFIPLSCKQFDKLEVFEGLVGFVDLLSLCWLDIQRNSYVH